MTAQNVSDDKSEFSIVAPFVIAKAKPLLQFESGLITVRAGVLDYVGPYETSRLRGEVIHLPDHLIIPGLVNVHTHTILTMVRGVAEDMGFAPAYTPGVPHGHEVTPDEAVALARLGALEAMLFGSTLINDSYVHADKTLPAMAELGLRVSTCSRIHDVDFSRVHLGEWQHDPKIGEATLERAVQLYEKWNGAFEGRAGVQFTPHAPDTCSRVLLETVADLSEKRSAHVATHLSQSRLENRRIAERENCTPTQLLNSVGLLNNRLIAAHGIYMTDADIEMAGKAGIHLAHIPKGNATGGQIAPTRKFAAAGMNLTLATDNMHADMIEVMRWALCMGRVQYDKIDDQWQPCDMLHMATQAGAEAMGLGDLIGSLEAGKRADFVCINLKRPHLVPRVNVLGNLVHTGQGRDVSMVVVDGRIVAKDGRPCFADHDAILRDAEQAAQALWQRARAQVALA
jgi:5-methylthioadenosine/S-adenosylhomocysteine deaminase